MDQRPQRNENCKKGHVFPSTFAQKGRSITRAQAQRIHVSDRKRQDAKQEDPSDSVLVYLSQGSKD